ncbi:MAG: hypothetical protein HEP71_04495 [Roseivirga sp.]|nr:hypothetical protein [Roseivirga sp.]
MNQLTNIESQNGNQFKRPFEDVTAEKSARIKQLQRELEEARKELADAEATYQSFMSKSTLMNSILAEAGNAVVMMTSEDKLALDAGQKAKSLGETSVKAMLTAKNTYVDCQNMLVAVQKVVEATLEAATDITLTAELIMKRKATNPLISSQLVSQATQAATDANKAVGLAIKALTATFTAYSTASQASFTSEITGAEIQYLKELVIMNPARNKKARKEKSIERLVREHYIESRQAEKEAQKAADESQLQLVKSKNDLTKATATLVNVNSALKAAEATVAAG